MRKLKHLFAVVVLAASMGALRPAQAQTFTVLHQFDGQVDDGAFPQGSIIRDAAGNLYGTTSLPGTLFKISANGTESVLAFVNGSELGDSPTGSLALDGAGNLYGVAEEGSGGAGTIFKVSPKGQGTVLFSFQGGLDNTNPKGPAGGVLLGSNGNIFGAAQFGNDLACFVGCGSIFRLDSTGGMHFLHKFTGGADGSNPIGPLVRDASGNLYGVAQSGGDHLCAQFFLKTHDGCGVVFKIDHHGVFTVLHTFTGGKAGAVPQGGLLLDASGNLYGATLTGGILKNGIIYKVASDGTYTVLHRFIGTDGETPNGGLVADANGNLFGTTQLGGDGQNGTVFEVSPSGVLTVLHNFEGLEDGAFPLAGLFRDQDGHLYGTVVTTGLIERIQGGNVFEITP